MLETMYLSIKITSMAYHKLSISKDLASQKSFTTEYRNVVTCETTAIAIIVWGIKGEK